LWDVFLVGFLEAGGDDGDFYRVFHGVVHDGAEDDVGVFVGGFLDDAGGFVDFVEGEAGAAGNVDEDALRALDGVVFEERARDGAVGGVNGAICSCGDGGAHDRVALAVHDGFDVGEIAVDDSWDGDDVGDALHCLAKNVVPRSTVSMRRSLGMTITVSTAPISSCRACSAWSMRRLPSKAKGLVTTATLSAPSSLASEATTGAAPLPVPPPRPEVMKIMSEPSRASMILSVSSSAALRPTSGFAPAPSPFVSFAPS
jgi:hypothetical protein